MRKEEGGKEGRGKKQEGGGRWGGGSGHQQREIMFSQPQ